MPHRGGGEESPLEIEQQLELLRLACLAGGWCSWERDGDEAEFVLMEEWLEQYERREEEEG